MARSEKDRMLAGELYHPDAPELLHGGASLVSRAPFEPARLRGPRVSRLRLPEAWSVSLRPCSQPWRRRRAATACI